MKTNVVNKRKGTAGLASPGSRRAPNGDTDRSEPSLTRAKARSDILNSMLAALNDGKITEFVEQFDDDFRFTDHALNLEFKGKGRLIEFFQKSRERFPDAKVEVVSTFESENSVIAEWRVKATEKGPYGSIQVRLPISFSGVSVAQFRNERIVRWTDYYDQAKSRRVAVAAYFTDWIELKSLASLDNRTIVSKFEKRNLREGSI
jgi:steroid delta-isomerase-like uncharacterized protein